MKIPYILFALLLAEAAQSQTVQQYTMYNQNHYLINPAAAGNENFADIRSGYRQQWSGSKDAPSTYYLSGHTVLNRPKNHERSAMRISETWRKPARRSMVKHAVGGLVNVSTFGAFNGLDASGSYALHLPINREVHISFGVSAGINSFSFDERKATVLYSNDPIYDTYATSDRSTKFNANTGVYIYSDKFFAGYSAQQLIRNEIGLSNIKLVTGGERFDLHHMLLGGYNFDLTNDTRLTPSVLLKQVGYNILIYDVNTFVTYKQFLSLGAGYRSTGAVSAMFSLQINNLIKIGYSYDYITSDIREVSNGGNELFIGIIIY
jgi:type IX secretion system PorP/SprF family membrane protein